MTVSSVYQCQLFCLRSWAWNWCCSLCKMDQQLCDEFAKEPWLGSPEFVWYDMVKWQWKTVSMRRCDESILKLGTLHCHIKVLHWCYCIGSIGLEFLLSSSAQKSWGCVMNLADKEATWATGVVCCRTEQCSSVKKNTITDGWNADVPCYDLLTRYPTLHQGISRVQFGTLMTLGWLKSMPWPQDIRGL